MTDRNETRSTLRHRYVTVEGCALHVAEAGDRNQPAVVFLHGWPQDWSEFEQVMLALSDELHVLAIDLPGIGESLRPPAANDKRTLARYVRGALAGLELQAVTLVGHDAGGQIVYAYLREYPDELARAVILSVVVPGIDPWTEVERNPRIWHFAFHAIPGLPEQLVSGHEASYFAYFYDVLSGPRGVSEAARARYLRAYSQRDALRTGFDWYRAFPTDVRDNQRAPATPIATPVLYLRGEHEFGELARYVAGLRDSGLRNVRGAIVPQCGHWGPDEAPEELAAALREFCRARV